MRNVHCLMYSAALLFPLVGAAAQAPAPGSKIVCWKDKSGKVIGCGDTVPLEYQDSATKELNRYGITVKQSAAALTAEQRKAQQAELERKQAEVVVKEEQRRQDRILLDTYSHEKDIEYERGRKTKPFESEIDSLRIRLKKINANQADARARAERFKNSKKAVPPETREELDRIGGETAKLESQIAQNRKDLAALNKKYDGIRKRYLELTGNPSFGSGASPAPQREPATSAASGKKP